jgi:hypothetical protein
MYKGNTSDPDINTTGNKTNTSVKIPTNDHTSPPTQWGGDDDDDGDWTEDKVDEYDDDEYDY